MVLRSDLDDYTQVAQWRAEDLLQLLPIDPPEVTAARRRVLAQAANTWRETACPTCGRTTPRSRRTR